MSMIVNPYRFGGSEPPGDDFWAVTSFALDGSGFTSRYRWGWVFTVGAEDLACNALRVQCMNASKTERVLIHRNSDDAIIAAANIAVGSANTWAAQAVTPFTLESGETYTISSGPTTTETRTSRHSNAVTFGSMITQTNPTGSVVNTAVNDNRPTSANGAVYRFCDFGHM